jgi:Dolichyl-phosphate-mannose-protein mannosyltransferase
VTERLTSGPAGRTAVRFTARATPTVLAVGAFAVLYASTTLVLAVRKHLWFDELFTYYIVRQPELGDVWRVLRTGVEPLPPFFYLVTRASTAVFGDGPIGIRAPELLGILLACSCLFVVVARRSTPLHGLIAMFVPLVTEAYAFAPEARPYGLVLGFSAAALLCWQVRTDGSGAAAVVGLALALGLATASHYYAVFVLVPLAAGEAVRAAGRRRVDLPVVGALAVAILPLALAVPFIRAARELSSTFWAVPHLVSSVDFFGWLLRTPAIPPQRLSGDEASVLVLGALAVAVYLVAAPLRAVPAASRRRLDAILVAAGSLLAAGAALSSRDLTLVAVAGLAAAAVGVVRLAHRRGSPRPPLPLHEVVAVAGFAFLPLLCVLVGDAFTGAYVHRYAIAAVIAPSVLLPLALHRLDGPSHVVSRVVAVLAAVFFLVAFRSEYRDISAARRDQRDSIELLRRIERDRSLPIVISHPHEALELARYAPPRLTARTLALASPAAAVRFVGSDSTERALLALAPLAPLRVDRLEPYLSRDRPFLLLWRAYFRDWLLPALRADGRALKPLERENGWTLYLVEPRRSP